MTARRPTSGFHVLAASLAIVIVGWVVLRLSPAHDGGPTAGATSATSTTSTTLPPHGGTPVTRPTGAPAEFVSTLTAPTTTPAGVVPPGACQGADPTSAFAFETVNTIAVTFPNPESFDAVVIARPDVACPGDVVEFEIQVQNLTAQPQQFEPFYGVLLVPGGPTKFKLADISLGLPPGETATTIVTAEIPPFGIGPTYGPGCATVVVGVGTGQLCILDPATARTD